MHLDCTFNPVGKDKCIIYKDGFVEESDYQLLLDIFGEENCFTINNEEMVAMVPNIFSIDHNIVVTDGSFTRLNQHLREQWNITVEEIPYREVSKMGGLYVVPQCLWLEKNKILFADINNIYYFCRGFI